MMSLPSTAHSGQGCSDRMEIPITDQLRLVALSLLTGLGAGVLYDLSELLKREGKRKRNAICNAVFFMSVTAAAFVLSMADIKGQSFIIEGACIISSFWTYVAHISPKLGKALKLKGKN